MLTSAVICKQRLLYEDNIVQLLRNYKCYGAEQSHSKKPLKSSAKNVKSSYRKTTRSFLRPVQFATFKACVRYFLTKFSLSQNDSPSKTITNVFYFI